MAPQEMFLMNSTNTGNLIKGIGIGMVAGAAISLALSPKNPKASMTPGKAVMNIGTVIEKIGRSMT